MSAIRYKSACCVSELALNTTGKLWCYCMLENSFYLFCFSFSYYGILSMRRQNMQYVSTVYISLSVFVFSFIDFLQLTAGHSLVVFCLWQTLITETGSLLDTVSNISFIHARFFDLSSQYYAVMHVNHHLDSRFPYHPCVTQTTASYADYYRDALRYLGCVELTAIPGWCACR